MKKKTTLIVKYTFLFNTKLSHGDLADSDKVSNVKRMKQIILNPVFNLIFHFIDLGRRKY